MRAVTGGDRGDNKEEVSCFLRLKKITAFWYTDRSDLVDREELMVQDCVE